MTARGGGIFQGNVLGSYQGLSCKGASLGADDFQIPWWCWDTPKFKQAHTACWDLNPEPDKRQSCVQTLIDQMCPWSKEPVPKTGYSQGDACTSDAVVRHVQAMIGTFVDGKWGTNSRTALAKSGKTFKEWAPGCTGAAPNGGGTVAPVTPAAPPTTPPGASVSKAGFMELPTIAWAGIAGVALVLVLAANKKKKG